jgi:hypothetical protein
VTIRTIGVHRVRHGDVTSRLGMAELMGPDSAEIMYSDPPWGAGNIKFWATMNAKMTGQVVQPASLESFLEAVFLVARTYATRYLLIEYGIRWKAEIQAWGKSAGFDPQGVAKIQYRGGGKVLPLDLHVFTRAAAPIPPLYFEALHGTMGYTTVRRAIAPLVTLQPPDRVVTLLDPCCGLGYTAQAAVDLGCRFRGNELNRVRLDTTIKRLQGGKVK